MWSFTVRLFYRSRYSSAFLQNGKDLHSLISMVTSTDDLNPFVRHWNRRAARLRAAASVVWSLTGVRDFRSERPDRLWGPLSLAFRVHRGFSQGVTAGAVSRSFLTEVNNDWSYTSIPHYAHKAWRGITLLSTCKTQARLWQIHVLVLWIMSGRIGCWAEYLGRRGTR